MTILEIIRHFDILIGAVGFLDMNVAAIHDAK